MKKILIISSKTEYGFDNVISQLKKNKKSFVVIDTEKILTGKVKLIEELDGVNFKFKILDTKTYLESDEILSIWYRRPNFKSGYEGLKPLDSDIFARNEWKFSIHPFSSMVESFWMNNPISGLYILEHNKLLQMKLAAESGFKVPDTLITNSYEELVNFCAKHNGVIACKPIHGGIFEDNDKIRYGLYTQVITLKELLKFKQKIKIAPILAQEYIDKKLELRVTVVGRNILVCAIHSQSSEKTKHDWRRYDFENVKHEIYQLPEMEEMKLNSFMKKCHINFGAVDLIIDKNGEFVFLEVNPNGQFGWIEELTGLNITKTIANSLSNPIENGLYIHKAF